MAKKYESITVDALENILEKAGEEGCSIPEMLDCFPDIHDEDVLNAKEIIRQRLRRSDRVVKSKEKERPNEKGQKLFVYYYIAPSDDITPVQKEVPLVKEDTPYKNAEKYNDPTAGRAIELADGRTNTNGVMPAAIYRTVKNELFLVVRQYPDTVLGYKVQVVDKHNVTTDSSVVWADKGEHHYLVNTNRVCTINWRTLILTSFQRCPFDAYRAILRRSPFQPCRTVEIPVEKEVVKEVIKEVPVEVPVEVIKEVVKEVPVETPAERTDESTELALAYQRISLLEDMNEKLYRLLEGCCNA